MNAHSTDTWKVLGDPILAYRLHIVKKAGWSWKGDANLTTKTYTPAIDAGFMSHGDKVDDFEASIDEVAPKDVEFFAAEQEYDNVGYTDVEDDEEEWSFAVVDG